MAAPEFAVGSLVRARGREWVVLPDSKDDLLVLRPLGGRDDEVSAVYLPEEGGVEPATFDLPDPERVGDFASCSLLRDAIRLGFRSGAGPFRSFAAVAVEPRSYQLVPLLLALKLDPVRLLIADDVGIGKTVEACLIAKELLERGEADGLAVLCPPHLAEQWQRELRDKFHIESELVLSSTAARLERECVLGQSLFDKHRHVVVSLDYIKSPRRRQELLRACPNLVIVDEAHTCAHGAAGRGRQLRHELVRDLAKSESRHLVLVSATPHSGKEEAFRSLLAFLDPSLADLPADLTGPENAPFRRRLAQHFVQRRRADIEHYLGEDTPFPKRDPREETYQLSPEYSKFFDRALAFARETVEEAGSDKRRQRVRWWAALALLRCIGSSPAAAAATLRARARALGGETAEDVDRLGEEAVLDLEDDEAESADIVPGSDYAETEEETASVRRRLLDMANVAETFAGKKDKKLERFTAIVDSLLAEGRSPIVFCRFIPTAEYVAEHLRKRFGKKATIDAVTGLLPPEEREARVAELGKAETRVLVCTDCLSEGINLQDSFDAVVHYDLSWNPTRHEQREGRVDRYGQPRKTVSTVLYYGANSPIDGLVLRVLIRKHKAIRNSLGISVPVPVDSAQVVNALTAAILFKSQGNPMQLTLPGFVSPVEQEVIELWDAAADREKRSRTVYAQESIKPDEVMRELEAARNAVGSRADVESFVRRAFTALGAAVTDAADGHVTIDLRGAPSALREVLGLAPGERLKARFELPVKDGVLYLSRTHPIVAGLAAHVLDVALDEGADFARRCGVIRTDAVSSRATILLLRERFQITARFADGRERSLLAEDARAVAFAGSTESATWLDPAAIEPLLAAKPRGNVAPDQARDFAAKAVGSLDALRAQLEDGARVRSKELLDAHVRVRKASQTKGLKHEVEPKLPVDILGAYVLLPAPKTA